MRLAKRCINSALYGEHVDLGDLILGWFRDIGHFRLFLRISTVSAFIKTHGGWHFPRIIFIHANCVCVSPCTRSVMQMFSYSSISSCITNLFTIDTRNNVGELWDCSLLNRLGGAFRNGIPMGRTARPFQNISTCDGRFASRVSAIVRP